ncbi:MAG TPA: hypothetical protein DGT23_07850 [Micromonosporaceae bacterium]|nr:hypothetical protein [Micromonosporaceae bacterium]
MAQDPHSLVAMTVATLQRMPASERARSAGELIAAVQGEGDRRIARIRWAAIAEMHEGGLTVEDIAAELAMSPGAVDLAVQSHRRYGTAPVSA